MFIVDHSKDYYGSRINIETFETDSSVIEFVSDESQDENFKVHRINKYEGGKLYPHELEIQNGRIVLTKLPTVVSFDSATTGRVVNIESI